MKSWMILLLVILSPGAQGADDSHQKLLSLTSQAGLSVTGDPDVLIHGGADAALSRGAWSETRVHAFTEQFGYRPTVLPLTYRINQEAIDEGEEPGRYANFYLAPQSQTYYLYVNLPTSGEWRENLGQQCASLLDTAFQDRLLDNGFARLPSVNRQLWRVRLGLRQPRLAGGYL